MTDVVMPQMGESITEGTISRWLKRVGDMVQRDEPLLEISTDKVDAEIPAPASGRLAEILVQEGATVPVQTVLARIEAAAEQPVVAPARAPLEAALPVAPSAAPTDAGPVSLAPAPNEPEPRVTEVPADLPEFLEAPSGDEPQELNLSASDELRRTRSSPLVRRIAAEHRVDLNDIQGTGLGGRVTKEDIFDHIQRRGLVASPAPPPAPVAPTPATVAPAPAPATPVPPSAPVSGATAGLVQAAQSAPAAHAAEAAPLAATVLPTPPAGGLAGPRDEVVPMTPIRKRTAEHMAASRRIAAHATTLFEVDMSRVEQLRSTYKRSYHERGVALTYLPFILKATVDALKAEPLVNASVDGERIIYHRDINLGIAVALERGLIVPVLRNADEKNVLGLARALTDLVERARTKRLTPDELHGGTFTVTNPGVFGSLFGTPIIHQPQVAILAVGVVEKRPVVRDDAIAIRSMAYLALSFDHRLIDGADADRFMAQLKRGLQEFDESAL